jgi:hypothetical protein
VKSVLAEYNAADLEKVNVNEEVPRFTAEHAGKSRLSGRTGWAGGGSCGVGGEGARRPDSRCTPPIPFVMLSPPRLAAIKLSEVPGDRSGDRVTADVRQSCRKGWITRATATPLCLVPNYHSLSPALPVWQGSMHSIIFRTATRGDQPPLAL